MHAKGTCKKGLQRISAGQQLLSAEKSHFATHVDIDIKEKRSWSFEVVTLCISTDKDLEHNKGTHQRGSLHCKYIHGQDIGSTHFIVIE